MAQVLHRGSKSEYDGIKKWGFQLQQRFPDLKDYNVLFHDEEMIQPFKDWEYYKAKSKDSKNIIKEKDEKSIPWWRSYNKVKHHRIGLIEETNHFLAKCIAEYDCQEPRYLSFAVTYNEIHVGEVFASISEK